MAAVAALPAPPFAPATLPAPLFAPGLAPFRRAFAATGLVSGDVSRLAAFATVVSPVPPGCRPIAPRSQLAGACRSLAHQVWPERRIRRPDGDPKSCAAWYRPECVWPLTEVGFNLK
jgi:hypothetical protein